jgi:hypothetical protein
VTWPYSRDSKEADVAGAYEGEWDGGAILLELHLQPLKYILKTESTGWIDCDVKEHSPG